MRTVVISQQLSELEVHPSDVYRNWVDVCGREAEQLASEQGNTFIDVNCPACGAEAAEEFFSRNGYQWMSCNQCCSIYVRHRPTVELQRWFLNSSEAAQYRKTPEYLEKMLPHMNDLSLARADLCIDILRQFNRSKESCVVDLESRNPLLLSELQRQGAGRVISVDTAFAEELLGSAGNAEFVDTVDEVESDTADLFSLFDIIEHCADVKTMVAEANRILKQDGVLVISTRCGSGFDIQTLGGNATILPLAHLNLISVEGMRTLLDANGFDIIELSTPGQLDVQMIQRVLKETPEVELPRFVKYLLKFRDRLAHQQLQMFLQENLLSSHMRVVARKR